MGRCCCISPTEACAAANRAGAPVVVDTRLIWPAVCFAGTVPSILLKSTDDEADVLDFDTTDRLVAPAINRLRGFETKIALLPAPAPPGACGAGPATGVLVGGLSRVRRLFKSSLVA